MRLRLLLLLGLCALGVGHSGYARQSFQAGQQPTTLAALCERPYRPPVLHPWQLPWQSWQAEYRRYFQRHYHDCSLTFWPSMIVMHYTVIPEASRVYRSFVRGAHMSAGDSGVVFGHPSVQLMIDTDGNVYQLMPLDRRCTGAYGVNHRALSIEMVARNEKELMSRPQQVFASFCLVRYLMARFDIPASKIVAHYEVSAGRSVVPEYTDYADSKWPDRYPNSCRRTDPGQTYMSWLRTYLARTGPTPQAQAKAPAPPEPTPEAPSEPSSESPDPQ